MQIEVASQRKNRGVSDLDGLGVGRLALKADDDADRKLITSIYRCLNPPRPQTMEQVVADNEAATVIRQWLSIAQSRINLQAAELRQQQEGQPV